MKQFSKRIVLSVFIFLLFYSQCFAKHNGDYLNKVTTRYITPHLQWASPLPGNKIKCLFLVGRQGAREVVEIWQRLDIDFDVFVTWWHGELAKEDMYELSIEGTSVKEKKKEILEKLEKDYDVIIISIGFDILPAEARYKIFEKVKNGTGLIFFNPGFRSVNRVYKKVFSEKESTADMFKDVSFDGIPGFDKDTYYVYQYGKGRIIGMRGGCEGNVSGYYQGLCLTIPRNYSRFWKFYYENNLAFVAKAILFAAKREPGYFIDGINFKNGQVFKTQDFPFVARFSVSGKQDATCNVWFRIRNEWNEVCLSETTKISTGINKGVSLNMPFLRDGKYSLDFIISNSKGEIENFGYFTFTVNSDIGKIYVSTDKDYYEKSEEVQGKITFENPLTKNGVAVIRLVDSPYKKIWFQKSYEIASGQKEVEFNIDYKDFPTLCGYIEVEIKQDDKSIIKGEKKIFFPERKMPLYPSFLWSFSGCPYPELYYPQIVRAGFDAVQEGPDLAAQFNLRIWPMVTRIYLWVNRKSQDEKKGWTQFVGMDKILSRYEDEIKKFDPSLDAKKIKETGDLSFSNPVIKNIFQKSLKENILKNNYPSYSPLYYDLGDENSFTLEGGYSPSENKAFIQFLKEKYKKIDILNQEWQENFGSFEQVNHYYLDDMKKQKKYAAYYDHVCFLAKQYADVHHTATQVIKEIDPNAYVGAEGSSSGDIEYTISKLDVWGPYSNIIENEILRSLGRDKLRTIWWGGYVNTHGGRNDVPAPLWGHLLSGIVNGNSFFMAGPWNEGFLSIDLSYAGYFENMLPHLMKLEDGIAQSLVVNDLKNYGIAIFYSFPSQVISRFGEKKFIPLSDSCSSFISFCYRNGLNLDFLSSPMLKEGKLKNYKVLFLFGATSISLEDREKIQEFVQNGGLVIADINPGIANENCRVLEKNQWQELFPGLSIVEEFANRDINVSRKVNGKGINLSVKNLLCASEPEVFQVNPYGKGNAILLNFTLKSLIDAADTQEDFDGFLLNLLSLCGIEKEIQINDFKGVIGRIAVRENPEFKIVGLLIYTGSKGDKLKFSIRTNGNPYIYKLDEGFVAQASTITETMNFFPNLQLYSVFKEKQDKPEVRIKSNSINRGEKIQIELSQRKNRIYRVQLSSGTNEVYKKVIQSEERICEIPVAYNDTPGDYSLIITDVITGLKEILKIKII